MTKIVKMVIGFDKSVIGFVLTLVGGILQVLGGLFAVFVVVSLKLLWFVIGLLELEPKFVFYFYSLFGGWAILLGALSIVSAVKMKSDDSEVVRKWSIAAIVFAVLSFGNVLVLAGGILGLIDSKKKG